MFHVPEHYRITKKDISYNKNLQSDASYGNNGYFSFYFRGTKHQVTVIASDGMGWEHVSVTVGANKPPTWELMCVVKNMFWDDEDCVVQYHPPKSSYINNHPHCLHLWKPIDKEIPIPDSILVGIKDRNVII